MLLFLDFISYYSEGISSNGINWEDKIVTASFTLLGTTAGAFLGYMSARMLDAKKNKKESERRIRFLKYEQKKLITKFKEHIPHYDKYVKDCKSEVRIKPTPIPNVLNVLDRITTKLEVDKYYVSYVELHPDNELKFTNFLEEVEYLRFNINNIISIAEKAIVFQHEREVEYKKISDKIVNIITNHTNENPIINERLAHYDLDNKNAKQHIKHINEYIGVVKAAFFNSEPVKNKNHEIVNMLFIHNQLIHPIYEKISEYKLTALLNTDFFTNLTILENIIETQKLNVDMHLDNTDLDLNKTIDNLELCLL